MFIEKANIVIDREGLKRPKHGLGRSIYPLDLKSSNINI